MLRHGSTPALLAALLCLGACGDDDAGGEDLVVSSAPTDASVEDFCEVIEGFAALEPNLGEDVDDWPERLVEVGTPADMSAEQRRGFEVYVSAYADHSGENEAGIDWRDVLTADELSEQQAFYSGYVYDNCQPYGEDE